MTFVQQRGGEILRRLPVVGPVRGAEVGVWDGRLSQYLLSTRADLRLYMVDRWCDVPVTHRYRQSNSQMASTTADGYAEVKRRAIKVASRFPDRARTLQGESVEMADFVSGGSLDFAFIDADHSYDGVREDLQAWWPKLKPGGLMCGHDWDHPDHQDEWGVRAAVEQFAFEHDMTVETGKNRTWFLVH